MTTLTTRNVVQQRKLAAITSAHTKAVLKNLQCYYINCFSNICAKHDETEVR